MTDRNPMRRPFEVAILGWLFIAVGILSTAHHLRVGTMDRWMIVIVAVGVIAFIGGIFLLRGANWARWLLLAWLAGHVVAVAFDPSRYPLPHAVLLLIIGYALLRPPVSTYFQRPSPE